MKFQSLKTTAAAAMITALVGGIILLATPRLQADDHGDCEKKIGRAEARLDQTMQKRGESSHEAEERRADLNAERQRCWDKYHGWWDGKEQRWHADRDWDHDRDHDGHHDEH